MEMRREIDKVADERGAGHVRTRLPQSADRMQTMTG